jgi:hypothetical protein
MCNLYLIRGKDEYPAALAKARITQVLSDVIHHKLGNIGSFAKLKEAQKETNAGFRPKGETSSKLWQQAITLHGRSYYG